MIKNEEIQEVVVLAEKKATTPAAAFTCTVLNFEICISAFFSVILLHHQHLLDACLVVCVGYCPRLYDFRYANSIINIKHVSPSTATALLGKYTIERKRHHFWSSAERPDSHSSR